MRIAIVNSMMSAPDNWKSESNLLLLSKLARYLARSGVAHVSLLVPDLAAVDFIAPEPGMTVRALPSLYERSTLAAMGYVVEPGALLRYIQEHGIDVILTTQSRIAAWIGVLLECDNAWRTGAVNVPLIVWDVNPTGHDIIERGKKSGGPMVAMGFMAASHVWCASESVRKADRVEVLRNFGFAQAQKFYEKSSVVSAAMDYGYMQEVAPVTTGKRERFTVHVGGRWSATKGYGMVAEAVMKLKASGVAIDILCTGMPGTSEEYKKALTECGMETINGLTQEEMWRVVRGCHVAVLAQDCQAVPTMAFEQLALGLPLLVKSTERLVDVMPRYPLVFDNETELMTLLVAVQKEYDAYSAQVQAWFAEHWQMFDVSLFGSIFEGIRAALGGQSVAVTLDEEGVPSIDSRGKKMLFFQQSVFARTMARRELLRLGHGEDLRGEVARFYGVEEVDPSPALP